MKSQKKREFIQFIFMPYLGQTQYFHGRYLEQRRVVDGSDIDVKGEPEVSLEVSWECIACPSHQCQFQNHAVLCGFATVMHVLYLSGQVNYRKDNAINILSNVMRGSLIIRRKINLEKTFKLFIECSLVYISLNRKGNKRCVNSCVFCICIVPQCKFAYERNRASVSNLPCIVDIIKRQPYNEEHVDFNLR